MLERSCGAVVYTEQNGSRQYVLVKGGYVGLPKGHIEEGETERQTAVREVREETCVSTQLIPGFRRTVLYHMPNGNDKRVVYFLANFESQEAHRNPEEFLKVIVLGYNDAMHALTFENDRATLRAAEYFLRRGGGGHSGHRAGKQRGSGKNRKPANLEKPEKPAKPGNTEGA